MARREDTDAVSHGNIKPDPFTNGLQMIKLAYTFSPVLHFSSHLLTALPKGELTVRFSRIFFIK